MHPHVLETLTGKTATLANFQRVRRMLRLLAHTVTAPGCEPTAKTPVGPPYAASSKASSASPPTSGAPDRRTLHVRTATQAEPEQRAIYDALGIDPQPGGVRKTTI